MNELIFRRIDSLYALHQTFSGKFDTLQTSVNDLKPENIWWKVLPPLLGVILGAVISYFGQRYLKKLDISQAIQKERREAISKITAGIFTLNFSLKEWAYLEVDSKYQWNIYENAADPDPKKKALDEHYNDYSYIAQHKKNIAVALSDITGSFHNYYRCLNQAVPAATDTALQELSSHILSLERQTEFSSGKAVDILVVQNATKLMQAEYTKNIQGIRTLANTLSS